MVVSRAANEEDVEQVAVAVPRNQTKNEDEQETAEEKQEDSEKTKKQNV